MISNIKSAKFVLPHEMPIMIMMMGIPGCGKSSIAEEFQKNHKRKINIHASDVLRKELFGDEDVQNKNNEVFMELHRRIKEDLRNGIDVIYDATNINKKRRCSFLQYIKSVNCFKICMCVVTPYDVCLQLNGKRERVVPDHIIKKMYMSWQPPSYDEGFDGITICCNYTEESENDYKIQTLLDKMENFDQENSHHKLTLGNHCLTAKKYIDDNYKNKPLLALAALLHDNGKMITKTRTNARGIYDGNCHYYNHQSCGAYDSMLYLVNAEYDTDEIVYISNLIFYHMHPYMQWKQSSSCMKRDKRMIGNEMYEDIMILHNADLFAH